MSSAKRDRVEELLSDRALEGLSAEDAAELAALMDGADDPSFDLAAAAADLAVGAAGETLEPLPAHLAARIEARAAAVLPSVRQPESFLRARPLAPARRRDPVRLAGWFAAAACLALAATAWLTRPTRPPVVVSAPAPPPSPPAPLSPAELRAQVLAAPDALRVGWTATKDPAATGASGDVVWSSREQRGYMRFHGLASNDASKAQYQLWIFDPSQDAKTPIDGGVFDVDPSSGDVLVPVTPKLRVTHPTLFAVTVEKPGGVVVSKRERIVVLAPVKG